MTEEQKLQKLEENLKYINAIKKRLIEIRDQREIAKLTKRIDNSKSHG